MDKTHEGRFMPTALLSVLPVLLPLTIALLLLPMPVLRNCLSSTLGKYFESKTWISSNNQSIKACSYAGFMSMKSMRRGSRMTMTHSWRWRPCCPLSRLVTTSQLHLLLSSAPPALVHCQMGPEGQDLINLPPPQPSFSS